MRRKLKTILTTMVTMSFVIIYSLNEKLVKRMARMLKVKRPEIRMFLTSCSLLLNRNAIKMALKMLNIVENTEMIKCIAMWF